MNVHELSVIEANPIPAAPGWTVLRLSGTDGAVEAFTVETDTLERIVEALDAELSRLRARGTTH